MNHNPLESKFPQTHISYLQRKLKITDVGINFKWKTPMCNYIVQFGRELEKTFWSWWRIMPPLRWSDTLSPKHNGRHFTNNIFKHIFLNENFLIWIKFHWNMFLMEALVHIMAWRRIGDKPSSEAMFVCFTNACMRHSTTMSGSLETSEYFHTITMRS